MHQKKFKVRIGLNNPQTKLRNLSFSDGEFGATMSVTLTNEGPVTFTLESRTPSSPPTATQSTRNTRSNTPSAEVERRKALRKAEWEKKKATNTGPGAPAQAT